MTNNDKKNLANWLELNSTNKTDSEIRIEISKYTNYPKYLYTPSGKVSKSGIRKFCTKYAVVKQAIPVQQEEVTPVADLLNPIATDNHYILCIDESGSTANISKQITEGVNTFVKNLVLQDKNAKITMITFGRNSNVTMLPTVLANNFKSYKHEWFGGTPLNETIQEAMRIVDKISQITIVIFTDGEATDREKENNTKKMVAEYKGSIVFIGTGEKYAKEIGIKTGNILPFQATQKGTEEAFQKLATASVEHSKAVKRGEDVTKREFFINKTDLMDMLQRSANISMSVCFECKLNKEQESINIADAKQYLTNIGGRVADLSDKDYKKLSVLMNRREERVLKGKHDGTRDGAGRYNFIDFEVPKGQNPHRLVNPDTMLWIEINGEKYFKKK